MYTMNFSQIGANIQKELDNKSMTQESLADELSISKHVMSKIQIVRFHHFNKQMMLSF